VTRAVRAALGVGVVALAVMVSGCGGSGGIGATSATSGSGAPSPTPGDRTTVTVLVAASAVAPVQQLATAFEASHPTVSVRISGGSSTTLVAQVAAGAPADLVLTAGDAALAGLPPSARARPTVVVATNILEIATPPSNPARIAGLADLTAPSVKVVACVPSAPCGAAADTALAKAGVTAHFVSREFDARATLAKVRLSEVDAAIVYRSDVVGSGGAVHGIPIPAEHNVTLAYPLVRLTDSPEATAFAAALSGVDARSVWATAGFGMP
jgi:molybdate transport system substrate-binding protein